MELTPLIEKISIVFGLVIQCPFDDPVETCPAFELRKLPTEEKFQIVNNLTEEQLDDIIAHHKKCLREREKKLFNLDNTEES